MKLGCRWNYETGVRGPFLVSPSGLPYIAVRQCGLWTSIAVLVGIVAAAAALLKDWPLPEDIRG